jgi:hypothetical protein
MWHTIEPFFFETIYYVRATDSCDICSSVLQHHSTAPPGGTHTAGAPPPPVEPGDYIISALVRGDPPVHVGQDDEADAIANFCSARTDVRWSDGYGS